MKKLNILLLFGLFLTFGIALSSCAGNSEKKEAETTEMNAEDSNNAEEASTDDAAEEADKTGKEYTSAFVCPMHCKGSGSDEAGKCPACGMDYVANEEHKSDGHTHDDEG